MDLLTGKGLQLLVDQLLRGYPDEQTFKLRGCKKGTVIGAGARIKMLYSDEELRPDLRPVIRENFRRIKFELSYTCIYDEVYTQEHDGFD